MTDLPVSHPEPTPRTVTRREVLLTAAGVTGAAALASLGPPVGSGLAVDADDGLPDPTRSGIEHIVVVMMENRSFDHFFGWVPGTNGLQAGLRYRDATGAVHATHHLAPDFQGCGFADPDHSFEGGRVEYDGGRCDGFLRAGNNDLYSIGYYVAHDLPFYKVVAPRFVTPDNYFAAILGPTFPNRIYQHSGTTDRLSNTQAISTLPTIWDRLADKGVTGRYYYSDLPFLGLWGAKYLPIAQPVARFLADASAGTLPSVAYVDPRFVGEAQGVSNDDHPFADIRNGQAFLDSIFRAVTTGPGWSKTVLVINYDEWGGFFDHVPPPAGSVTDAEKALGYTDGLRGFRVPCLVISPWSQHKNVPHAWFDHTSVLKMIEWRFGLPPLSVRDAEANNLATVLDFKHPRLHVVQPNVPPGPYGGPCPPVVVPAAAARLTTALVEPVANDEWGDLRAVSTRHGWPIL